MQRGKQALRKNVLTLKRPAFIKAMNNMTYGRFSKGASINDVGDFWPFLTPQVPLIEPN